MIARLRGEVVEALPNRLVVEAGGVGYQVFVPISSFDRLNPREGEEVILLTHLHVRETAHTLYGFATAEEREVAMLRSRLLIAVPLAVLVMAIGMGGGAAVLGAAVIAARLKLPVNLRVLVPAAENMPALRICVAPTGALRRAISSSTS